MTTTIQVNTTEKLKTSYGTEVPVVRGKLSILKTSDNPILVKDKQGVLFRNPGYSQASINASTNFYNPVIIIEGRDEPVLIKTEHLSYKQVESIIEGKIKNQDFLWVECEEMLEDACKVKLIDGKITLHKYQLTFEDLRVRFKKEYPKEDTLAFRWLENEYSYLLKKS